LPKRDGVPQPRRHEKRLIAAAEGKRVFASAVFANDLDGTVDADHELRPAPMRVAAARRAGRRGQGEHPLDPERYLRRSFGHHHFPIRARMPRQVNETLTHYQHAAIAGGNVLDCGKRKHCEVRNLADALASVGSAQRVRSVLNYFETVFVSDRLL